MRLWRRILKIYGDPHFKDKLKKILATNIIRTSDMNKLFIHFYGLKKKDILKIILDHHQKPSSISVLSLVRLKYADGLYLLEKYVNVSGILFKNGIPAIGIAAMLGDFKTVNFFINKSYYQIFDLVKLRIMIPHQIIDDFFSVHSRRHLYFSIINHSIKTNIDVATYVMKNHTKWGNYNESDYIDAVMRCFISHYEFRLEKIVYEHLHQFFPHADYSYLIKKIFTYGDSEMLKMILTDNPRLMQNAFNLMIFADPGINISKIVLALTSHNFIDPLFTKSCDLRFLIEDFNKNPHEVKKKLRKELGLASKSSMIFALTIFLCDDFLEIIDW